LHDLQILYRKSNKLLTMTERRTSMTNLGICGLLLLMPSDDVMVKYAIKLLQKYS
jgi:hypothetical protein